MIVAQYAGIFAIMIDARCPITGAGAKMMRMRRHVILTIFAALGLTTTLMGCGDTTDCSTDGDCFSGEYCADGTCVAGERPLEMNNLNNANNTSNNGSNNANNMGSNNVSANNTSSNNVNNTNNTNNTNTNNTNNVNNTNNIGSDACVVDPFDPPACELDDNDSFAEAFHDRTVACQNDGFVPLDKTISAAICLRETVDKYSQLYVDCDDQSFVFEVTFTPKTDCDPSLYNFDVFIAGLSCEDDGTEPGIRCETLSDGSQRAQVIVPPGRSVNSGRFEVEALQPDTIQLEYDLRVVIRQ